MLPLLRSSSTMNNNGYCYLDSCHGTMKKEPEETCNCNGLTMNSSLLPATGTTTTNAVASLTKQLFDTETNPEHPLVTEADYDADLKYGIQVFINNNTITTNNNNSTTTSSNSIASDEDDEEEEEEEEEEDDDENYEDEVDDNDSGIVTSTTSAVTTDSVDKSTSHCQSNTMTTSTTAGNDNNDDSNNNDDDSTTSTSTTISVSISESYSSTATATTSKTNHYNNHNGPRKLRFAVGQDVLARWNDGLFYLGNILKVSLTFFSFVILH